MRPTGHRRIPVFLAIGVLTDVLWRIWLNAPSLTRSHSPQYAQFIVCHSLYARQLSQCLSFFCMRIFLTNLAHSAHNSSPSASAGPQASHVQRSANSSSTAPIILCYLVLHVNHSLLSLILSIIRRFKFCLFSEILSTTDCWYEWITFARTIEFLGDVGFL